MTDRKYPIHGAPDRVWTLVFSPNEGRWFVEELATNPCAKSRVPLDEFEQSETGVQLAPMIQAAVEAAAVDI